MSSKEILNDIINNFEPSKFIKFFSEQSRKFKPLEQSLSNYNSEDFSDGTILGEISLEDSTDFIIYNFKVIKPLSERSGKKAQYLLGKKILKEAARYSGGIFIFYDNKGDFRFSLIYDIPLTNGKRDWSNFRRFTYLVSKVQTNKTFLQQMDEINFSSLEKIIAAFSIEKVTKDFYTEIANWYFWALDEVEFPDDVDKKREERNAKNLIRLITRIIFVWFMKEKKLVSPSLFDKQFIEKVLNFNDKTGSTYYKAILQNLFFASLNTQMKKENNNSRMFIEDAKKIGFINEGYLQQGYYRYSRFITDKKLFLEHFGNIPFLNGGLFECLDKKVDGKEIRIDCFSDNPKNETRLKVPDKLFFLDEETEVDLSNHLDTWKNKKVRGLFSILKSYNFTIDENTPIDEEIALDPELLGKVFENLLASYIPASSTTARKSTGSYYTPRDIVEYMVNESLLEYLKTKTGNENNVNEDKIRSLFDYNDDASPFKEEPTITLKIIDAIENIKILDPACGSGAFPMGILHKLVLSLHKLDPDNNIWKNRLLDRVPVEIRKETERSLQNKSLDYIRKLGLIEHCIYGVDIQEIAIQITKLRFFISLLVEQQIDDSKINRDVRPLPNLETKFVAANTLIGLGKLPEELIDTEITNLSRKLFSLREEIFYSNSRHQKQTLEEKEEILRGKIEQALKDKFHKVTNVKIKQLVMETGELNKSLLQLKKEPEVIETISTTNLFGEKEIKRINKTRVIINSLTRRQNDYSKQIEALKNPKSNTSTAIAHKIASWNPFDQNTHADWFDAEWMFGPNVKDGFDITIGNPPYGVSIKNDYRKKVLNSLPKVPDYEIYYFFIEVAKKFLCTNGILSYIIPNSILFNVYAANYRTNLFNHWTIDELLDCTDFDFFEGATVRNVIIRFVKSFPSFQVGYRNTYSIKDFSDLVSRPKLFISKTELLLHNANWALPFKLNKTILNLISSIKTKCKPLIHFFPEISQGLIAYDKYRGQSTEIIKNRAYHYSEKVKTNLKPWLWGSDVTKYTVNWNNKEFIDYCDGIANPREPKFFKGERILIREITNPSIFAGYIDKEMYNDPAIIIVLKGFIIPIFSLLAILNSKLATFIHFNSSPKATKGAFPKIIVEDVKYFPLVEFSTFSKLYYAKLEKISFNVYKIKNSKPSTDTTALENQIDIIVYKLYNLTYGEVKIIDPEIEKIISEKDYEKF